MKNLFSNSIKTFNLKVHSLVIVLLSMCFGAMAQDSTTDALRNNFAKALVTSMGQPGVKDFLKTQIQRNLDGEDGILYANVANLPVGSRTFAQVLQSNATGSAASANYFAVTVIQADPLLTISMPDLDAGNVSTWQTASLTPGVAVEPASFDDRTTTTVGGYDSRGNAISYSVANDPTQITLVVRKSERIIGVTKATGTLIDGGQKPSDFPSEFTLVHSTTTTDFYKKNYVEPRSGDGGDGGGEKNVCQRDQKTTKDEIYKLRFNSKDDAQYAESWIKGDLEMEIGVLLAMNGVNSSEFSSLYKYFSMKRKDARDGKWKFVEQEILHWTQETHGDIMKYIIMESDENGISLELTFSFGVKFKVPGVGDVELTLGGTLKFDPKDDYCGESFVEYCDTANTPGFMYNTGRVKFHVRHRD